MPHPDDPDATYLDALPIREAAVGHGTLGLGGELGYEGKRAVAGGRIWDHALGAHPPSRLVFELGGRYGMLRSAAAIHDDVPAGRTHADFSVWGDGRILAVAPRVEAGAPPRPLEADLRGVRTLELVVRTPRWEFCHALWLDPVAEPGAPTDAAGPALRDCLGRTEFRPPGSPLRADRVIATIASRGFAPLLDDMLGSLHAHGGCPDVPVAVFAVEPDAACLDVAAKYGATLVPCALTGPLNATVKSALYSAARVLDARQFLCLDADLLVLGDLRPIFAALDACPEGTILACREGNTPGFPSLGRALADAYHGGPGDLERLLGGDPGDAAAYPLVVNDGVFAGGRPALLAADALIRSWPEAPAWVDERRDNWWRNQFVFNLALARLGAGVELDSTFNVQLQAQDVAIARERGRIRATWRGRPARVVHFNGAGRAKHPEWRGHFARAEPPPIAPPDAPRGDAYAAFLAALRGWLGGRGLPALAWSFYSTADGQSARVADPGAYPLFGLLHYLIRSHGCVRVLETGTARGVSAACLASAVAHRAGGRVVTLDLDAWPDRADLWAALPAPVAACIEPRTGDSLALMEAAGAAGERFEAALLDTRHDADHVLAEFRLARRLVRPGGLILIHDAHLAGATVGAALRQIAAEGFGVVHLWGATPGVAEDDHLGLALIENRPQYSDRTTTHSPAP